MAEKKEFLLQGLATPISHYCDAVRWGDLLFISGMAPVDAKGKVVSEDVAAQTRQQYFGKARPASTLIGVKELAIPGMKVEIEAVVGLKSAARP